MSTINLFRHESNVIAFSAGQTVIAAGEPGESAYVVVSGEVDVLLHGQVIETVGPGGMIGEMALIDAEPRSATVIARSDCSLSPVDEKRFLYMVQQTPYFALQVMQLMAQRLRRLNELAAA